jgi:hypothetical protein
MLSNSACLPMPKRTRTFAVHGNEAQRFKIEQIPHLLHVARQVAIVA